MKFPLSVSLKKANFDEFESSLNNKNDLVHCPSITLSAIVPPRKCGHSTKTKVWPNQSGKIQNWCNG
ncbi:CFF_collapsed_G0000010.mRNA.1.CDS.1 [Saccharomyces cerevisiae]|nr:CFF_collapsed_G0000010.mRNA.1.CDS.1 [Saccharomyces cerevisiae]